MKKLVLATIINLMGVGAFACYGLPEECKAPAQQTTAPDAGELTYKECKHLQHNKDEYAKFTLDSEGGFHVYISEQATYLDYSGTCKPTVDSNGQIELLNCVGNWKRFNDVVEANAKVQLASADGILNVLFYTLPNSKEPLNLACSTPSQSN